MSTESRDNAPAVSGSVTNYLCLAPEDKAKDALSVFNEIGIYLFPDVPASAAEAHSLAKQGTLALTLAYMPDPARAGEPLSPALDLRSVLFPPLVVLVDRAPSPVEQEALRIQGAAYILHQPADLERDAKAVRSLARSSSWLSAKLERMPLPDVLQTMAVHNQSGMVSIACRHMRLHSSLPWKHGQKLCRARAGLNRECPGWYGRLYVRDGMLVHAETPTAEGVPALAQLLRASAGSVRIHEVFILPQEPNITGSMHSNLLNAAWVADEDARNAPPSMPSPSVPGSRTSPHSTGAASGSIPPSAEAASSTGGRAGRVSMPEPAPLEPAAAKVDAGQPLSIDFDLSASQPANAPPPIPPPEFETTGPVAPFEPGPILSLTDFELTFPGSSVQDEALKKAPAAAPKAPLQQSAAAPDAPFQQNEAAPKAPLQQNEAAPKAPLQQNEAAPKAPFQQNAARAPAPAAQRPTGGASPPAPHRLVALQAPTAATPKEPAAPAAAPPAQKAAAPAATPAPAPQPEKPALAATPAPAAVEAQGPQATAAWKPNSPRPAAATRSAPRPMTFGRRPAPEVTVIDAPPLGSDKTKNPLPPPPGFGREPVPVSAPPSAATTSTTSAKIPDTTATPQVPGVLPVESPAARANADESTSKGAPETADLSALLKAAPDLRAAAKADKGGNVRAMAGAADAETICAVAALALKSLKEVEELVGLGSLRSFTVASSKVTLYVQHQPDGFAAALGDATKNAEATMRIVAEHAGAGGRR